MWRSNTRNVAARASAVRLGQTEGGNARSRPYLIDDEAGAGQKRELNAPVRCGNGCHNGYHNGRARTMVFGIEVNTTGRRIG